MVRPVWLHELEVTPARARAIQEEARTRVLTLDSDPAFHPPARLAAVDVGYDRASNRCTAALVLWDVAAGAPLAEWVHVEPSRFPYVPGLLTFRELPPLLPLLERLAEPPELLLCDGQGIAHPRRIGLASHLGLVFDLPTLGWAKSRLIGEYREPPRRRGAATPLMDGGEQIGWALRSRAGCRLTFVSPGHRISLARSLELARSLMGPCRLSEPARRAHHLTTHHARG